MSDATDPTLVLRSARWLPITCWAVLGVLIGEPVVRGQWGVVLDFGPGVLLAAWLAYLLFWQPHVEVGTDSIKVFNVWSITEVGFRLVTDIGTNGLLSVHYRVRDAAKSISAWGVIGKRPSHLGRRTSHVSYLTRSDELGEGQGQRNEQGAPGLARARWMSYAGSAPRGKVTDVGPNWPALVGTVLFGGLALLSWLT